MHVQVLPYLEGERTANVDFAVGVVEDPPGDVALVGQHARPLRGDPLALWRLDGQLRKEVHKGTLQSRRVPVPGSLVHEVIGVEGCRHGEAVFSDVGLTYDVRKGWRREGVPQNT